MQAWDRRADSGDVYGIRYDALQYFLHRWKAGADARRARRERRADTSAAYYFHAMGLKVRVFRHWKAVLSWELDQYGDRGPGPWRPGRERPSPPSATFNGSMGAPRGARARRIALESFQAWLEYTLGAVQERLRALARQGYVPGTARGRALLSGAPVQGVALGKRGARSRTREADDSSDSGLDYSRMGRPMRRNDGRASLGITFSGWHLRALETSAQRMKRLHTDAFRRQRLMGKAMRSWLTGSERHTYELRRSPVAPTARTLASFGPGERVPLQPTSALRRAPIVRAHHQRAPHGGQENQENRAWDRERLHVALECTARSARPTPSARSQALAITDGHLDTLAGMRALWAAEDVLAKQDAPSTLDREAALLRDELSPRPL